MIFLRQFKVIKSFSKRWNEYNTEIFRVGRIFNILDYKYEFIMDKIHEGFIEEIPLNKDIFIKKD